MSFCASLRNLSKSDHPRQKKMTSCRFSRWRISAILDFTGLIMVSFKSPCTTSCRSSAETIALNGLVFWENRLFAFWRQTDRQTNRWTSPSHQAALAVASSGLITRLIVSSVWSIQWFHFQWPWVTLDFKVTMCPRCIVCATDARSVCDS